MPSSRGARTGSRLSKAERAATERATYDTGVFVNCPFDDGYKPLFNATAFAVPCLYSQGFPGARFGAARDGDDERLTAFQAGYGSLPPRDEEWLDHFVFVRSLRRYPSPFAPELRAVIDVALERLPAF